MSHTLVAPVVATAADARPPERGGFFAHHGVMSFGVRLLRVLSFRSKLLLTMGCSGVPVAVLGYFFFQFTVGQLTFSQQERLGVEYVRAILPAVRATQDQRGLANRLLSGDAGARGAFDEAKRKLDDAMSRLGSVDRRLDVALGSSAAFDALARSHADLAQRAAGMTPTESFAAHTELINRLLALLAQVGKTSNLVLDPEATSFYVMQAVVLEGGPALEAIASTRGLSAGILASRQITPTQRQAIVERMTVIRIALERQRSAVESAIQTDSALRSRLAADEKLALTDSLVKSISADLLAEQISADPAAFWAAASRTLDAHYASAGSALDVLDDLLVQRIEALRSDQVSKAIIAGVFMLLSGYLLYSFYLVTRGGLHQLSDHIVRMADGDFSARPWPWGRDEVANALDVLRESLAAMSQMVADIRCQADAVSHAAGEIAAGNQDLSSRTETSAAAVEQSARGMEQLRDQVTANVAAIGVADQQIDGLNAAIGRVNETVTGLVQRMTTLHGQSREIAEIVGLIDGIAFQTNILALNASVEAARAGDLGRGFAVVAQEVRALAQRSAQAAKQVNGIVQASTQEIAAGSTLAHSAGASVKVTVDSAGGVADAMHSVRANSAQQRDAVEQAHQAMSQLASATQGNAALVEEIAAATTSLDRSGCDLTALVARFRVGDAKGNCAAANP
jgi:methyl-accepting chemotaxis protein